MIELGFKLREGGDRAHTGLLGFSAGTQAKGKGAGFVVCDDALPHYLCHQLIEGR